MIGKHLKSLDSLEYIANQFSGMKYGDTTLFDLVTVINSIELNDIKAVHQSFVRPEALSRFFIYPEER